MKREPSDISGFDEVKTEPPHTPDAHAGSMPTPSPFPTHCLPGVCGEIVRQIAKAALVPESLAASAVIGIVSAALGSGLEVQSGGDRRTRGNLFLLPIAQTGTGKDLAFNLAAAPLQQVEREKRERWSHVSGPTLKARLQVATKRIKTLEGQAAESKGNAVHELEDAIREKDAAEKALASCPLFITTDATREALAACLATQPGEALALMTAEGRGALSNILGRYTKGDATDEDAYCACFSGTPINQQRRTKAPIDLRRPCLTLLLMVQPDVWTRLSAMDILRESGLLPRFLTFDAHAEPEPLPLDPHCIPANLSASYARLIRALCDAYRLREDEPLCIPCPHEPYGLFRDFDNECRARRRTGGDVHDIAGFAARWAEQAWRLSVGLHAMTHGDTAHEHPLSAETAQHGITLARWFIEQQLVLLNADRRKRQGERVERLVEILGKNGGEVTLRALRDRHGFTREEVITLAHEHPRTMQIVSVQPETGRPSECLKLMQKG